MKKTTLFSLIFIFFIKSFANDNVFYLMETQEKNHEKILEIYSELENKIEKPEKVSKILNIIRFNLNKKSEIFRAKLIIEQKKFKNKDFYYEIMMGEYYLNLKEYKKSLNHLKKAEKFKKINFVDLKIAKIEYLNKNYNKSIEYLKNIKERTKEYEDIYVYSRFENKEYTYLSGYLKSKNKDKYRNIYINSLIKEKNIKELKQELNFYKDLRYYIYLLELENKTVLAVLVYAISIFSFILSFQFFMIFMILILIFTKGKYELKEFKKKIILSLIAYFILTKIFYMIANLITNGTILEDFTNEILMQRNIIISQIMLNFSILCFIIGIRLSVALLAKMKISYLLKGIKVYVISNIMMVFIITLFFPVVNFLKKAFPEDTLALEILTNYKEKDIFYVSFVLILSFFGPLLEEILFRGLIHNYIKRNFNVKIAILLTALIFALMHFQVSNFLQLFTLGLCFSYFYEKEQSLYPIIIAHMINNFVFAIILIKN